MALDFDTFTQEAYQSLWKTIKKVPRSVDALYLDGNGMNLTLYAVEFKAGEPDCLDLVRKAYDTVMCLTECGQNGFNYLWARCHVVYVVVCSDAEVIANVQRHKVFCKPWMCRGAKPVGNRFTNLAKIEGVLVSQVLVQTPTDFENLAWKLRWA